MNYQTIICDRCGEVNQKPPQVLCGCCKKLLEANDQQENRALRSLTAEITSKLGLVWEIVPKTSTTPAAFEDGMLPERARARKHRVHAITKGFVSIRDRYYRSHQYREFLHTEGVTVEHMQYWDSIADPALEIEQ